MQFRKSLEGVRRIWQDSCEIQYFLASSEKCFEAATKYVEKKFWTTRTFSEWRLILINVTPLLRWKFDVGAVDFFFSKGKGNILQKKEHRAATGWKRTPSAQSLYAVTLHQRTRIAETSKETYRTTREDRFSAVLTKLLFSSINEEKLWNIWLNQPWRDLSVRLF